MIVLIINGAPRTGKDTFIDILGKITKARVVKYSSIDCIKDIAKDVFDWDGTKDAKSRQLLSDLKDIATKWNDMPFKEICKRITRYNYFDAFNYFCTNIREPNEINKLSAWCLEKGISCYSVWIRRKEAEQRALDEGFLSSGDTQFAEYNYDFTLHNDGTIEEFQKQIKNKIDAIKEVIA